MQIPDDPEVYEQKINGATGYIYLSLGDRVYVPFCPYEAVYPGRCIGYCEIPASEDSEGGRTYICELKGYSPKDWIVEISDGYCREGMIYREINATDIPEGLVSEYEWNK